MESLSRESVLLSQGSMEAVMNITGINSMELDMYLKQETLLETNECFQEDLQFSFDQNFYSLLLPDSTQNQTPDVPLSTSEMPCTEGYHGPCAFDIDLSKNEGDKAKWEYSEPLNKLYVAMGGKVPIKFKYDHKEFGLSVRALPIFLAQDHFAEPVRRCPSHESSLETSNKDFLHVEHVIRCHHPNAIYDRNVNSERLSVIAPLDCPQPGTNWSTLVFSFMCKNSCSLGMNRRATAVIFTLERPNGEVIGRKVINIRICSCPRRDMTKDLRDLATKKESEELPGELEHENKDLSDDESQKIEKVKVKKPLKRLSKPMVSFNIRVSESNVQSIAKIIMEIISLKESSGELTPEANITLQDCSKYLN